MDKFTGTLYYCDFDEENKEVRIWLKNGDKTLVGVKRWEDRKEDIPEWQSFLLSNNLTPLSEVVVYGNEENGKIRLNKIESIGDGKNKLKKFYFKSIIYSDDGFPSAEKDPIVIIVCFADGFKTFVSEDMDDKKLIIDFIDFIKKYNPDIIFGFGQDTEDFPYIFKRAKKHKINFNIGKFNEAPIETGKYFRGMIMKETVIPGRINADFFPVAIREFPNLPTKSIEEVAEKLGIKIPYKEILDYEIGKYWKNKRKELIGYAQKKLKLIKEVVDKQITFQIELSKITKIMPQQVFRYTVGELVDGIVLYEAKKRNYPIGKRREGETEYYVGGEVWLKAPGIYENIAYFDFKSMYPSIISKFNISPETIDCDCCKNKVKPIIVEEGRRRIQHHICQKKKGLLAEIVRNLIEKRNEIKKDMKKYKEESGEYKQLDAKQHAIKVITNATYGYMGWATSRLYTKEGAEITTALGRKYIRELKSFMEKNGFEPIYLDTDGIQVISKKKVDIKNLVEELNKAFPISIEFQYIARRAIFFAKKKYCHLVNNEIEAKGMEFIRKDYPKIIKEAQRKVIEIILKEDDIQKAKQIASEFRKRIENKSIDKSELILIEQLGKKLEMYERTSKIKSCAEWLKKEKGIELHRGMNLEIVIIKGKEPINYRARPVQFFDLDDIDIDYYLTLFDQVIGRTFEIKI
ncbi:MAG: DNA-directed DNA polymerase [Candidatus Parvarchaeota archaeon]|nr:DNA-directed DNA polymerase [Candidatus Jingweiarchaeum tengchongense]MCW1298030.1 DNA-directed DNA polymerase [Candidatus Jingweiarchaeum tengchongense]MCW1300170.1 DNA-directed DNA polymerase [Candidatus Jingweiarchaeum tengchongense]MCW1304380.1 DNA-directed DNA polymerase [Candidatus Jingweiarchaeum tengchongense]MCW1305900.1 DNA-directed DNA polymerase [Candidatus Jingweiarchaeum tengchongense]